MIGTGLDMHFLARFGGGKSVGGVVAPGLKRADRHSRPS